jgi:dTDP-4-dehydrorhamnose reductase
MDKRPLSSGDSGDPALGSGEEFSQPSTLRAEEIKRVAQKPAKPKIVVTGCNGLLGQKVVELAGPRYRIVGIDLQKKPLASVDEYVIMDISQRKAVLDAVDKISPTSIVNSAAFTNVDACERKRDLAWKVNVDGVKHLLEASQKVNSRLIHISSDYVFDGRAGPYSEDASPHPLGFYGMTKLESERVLSASKSPWAVVRTCVLYGWADGVRLNFVLWIRAQLTAGKYVRAAIDQYSNPTLADNLAEGILTLLKGKHSGVYHIGGADYISRWAFARKIAQVFELNQELITPVISSQLSQRAPRPHWGGLKTARTAKKLALKMIGVQAGLESLKKQIPHDAREVP